MDCDKIRDLFGEYVEHQLNEEESKNFEKHMENCHECRNEFYKFEKVMFRLKCIKDIEPPKELKDKIMKKVVSEENKKLNIKIINFRKYSYVAAALVVFIFGSMYYKDYLVKKSQINEQNNVSAVSIEPNGVNGDDLGQGIDGTQEEMTPKLKSGFSGVPNENSLRSFQQEELQKKSSINLYDEGIEIKVLTDNIKEFKDFLVENIDNLEFYEEDLNYVEIVIDKNQFNNIKDKIDNIIGYKIDIINIDEILKDIENIINEGYITEEGLIKFKITIEQET